jgi:hypothetical protein
MGVHTSERKDESSVGTVWYTSTFSAMARSRCYQIFDVHRFEAIR